jgi:hypothetical protein
LVVGKQGKGDGGVAILLQQHSGGVKLSDRDSIYLCKTFIKGVAISNESSCSGMSTDGIRKRDDELAMLPQK